MKDLHYNYVYFNMHYWPEYDACELNPDEYNAICLRDLEGVEGVQVIQMPMQHFPKIIRRIQRWLEKLHAYKGVRLVKLLYPFYFKNNFKEKKPFCFVVANRYLKVDYLRWLKKRYAGCKFVMPHRDLVKVTYESPSYSEAFLNDFFDLRLTYDQGESIKYGLPFFHEIESKINMSLSAEYPVSDVFFCGAAKDRLPKLIDAYDRFTSAGLKCYFYIAFAKPEEKVYREGITYADVYMPYMEMLYNSVNARCMFDINQTGAVGYTSRFLEAIMYNKRFITDNLSVKDSKYYNPQYIQVITDVSEIDVNFVKQENHIDYGYGGEFSPIYLIKKIDQELVSRYQNNK